MGYKDFNKWGLHIIVMIINFNLVFSEAAGGRLLPIEDTSNPINDTTSRVDPLLQFQKYTGGYDITNIHYWSSAVFTGIYGYAIGLLWLVVGALYSIYFLATACCNQTKSRKLRKRRQCHKQCFLSHLVLTIVFAILAIIGSGVALGGTARFHSRAKTIVSILVDTADQASNTMHNATVAIKRISETLQSTDGVSDYGVDAASLLASTSEKLDYEAADIGRQARKNRHRVGKALTILYLATAITIFLNMAAVIALSVFGILRFRRMLHMLIILCWLLTTLCWLLFGAYFFLEKFTGDTCTALQEFQQNPENSSLSLILPCDELLSAKSILSDIGVGIYDIVDQVNANISLLRIDSIHELQIQYICNPFSGPPDYLYQAKDCPAGTIRIGDIPQVLKLFTCVDTGGSNCNRGESITTGQYSIIEAYTTSIQSLLDAYPDMESLVDCQPVKNAFSDILVNHCKPLQRYVEITWISTLSLSMVMMVLVILWVSTNRHDQKHHFADDSVEPNST